MDNDEIIKKFNSGRIFTMQECILLEIALNEVRAAIANEILDYILREYDIGYPSMKIPVSKIEELKKKYNAHKSEK